MGRRDPEVPPGSFWCPICRRLLHGPLREDRIDHALDLHRAELISGRLQILTGSELAAR